MKKLFLFLLIPVFIGGCTQPAADDKSPQTNGVNKAQVYQDQTNDTVSGQNEVDVPETAIEPPLNVDAEIAELFVEKYDYDFSEVTVTVDDYDINGYARGMVELGESGPVNQGGYLVALTEEGWVLVWDGNGFYDCEAVISYGFPEYMAPDCY